MILINSCGFIIKEEFSEEAFQFLLQLRNMRLPQLFSLLPKLLLYLGIVLPLLLRLDLLISSHLVFGLSLLLDKDLLFLFFEFLVCVRSFIFSGWTNLFDLYSFSISSIFLIVI